MQTTTDTARIDIQKLQLLTERLTLALDALNQVRLSAQVTHPAFHGQQTLPYGVPAYGMHPYNLQNTQQLPIWSDQRFIDPRFTQQFSAWNDQRFIDPRFVQQAPMSASQPMHYGVSPVTGPFQGSFHSYAPVASAQYANGVDTHRPQNISW